MSTSANLSTHPSTPPSAHPPFLPVLQPVSPPRASSAEQPPAPVAASVSAALTSATDFDWSDWTLSERIIACIIFALLAIAMALCVRCLLRALRPAYCQCNTKPRPRRSKLRLRTSHVRTPSSPASSAMLVDSQIRPFDPQLAHTRIPRYVDHEPAAEALEQKAADFTAAWSQAQLPAEPDRLGRQRLAALLGAVLIARVCQVHLGRSAQPRR